MNNSGFAVWFLIILLLIIAGSFGFFLWDTSSKLTRQEIALKEASDKQATIQQQLSNTQQQLTTAQQQMITTQQQLTTAQQQLTTTQQQLDDTRRQLQQKTDELLSARNSTSPTYVPVYTPTPTYTPAPAPTLSRPSFPFTPPALPPISGQKLLGLDAITHVDDNCLNSTFHLDRYVASQSGNVTILRVFCVAAGNIKLAIYADNNGEPGLLLNSINTSTPVYSGWNSIPIVSTTVTAGTNYWLAMNTESVILGAQLSTNNNAIRRFKIGVPYSSFTFPSQAGTGFNADSYICDIIIGWGQ